MKNVTRVSTPLRVRLLTRLIFAYLVLLGGGFPADILAQATPLPPAPYAAPDNPFAERQRAWDRDLRPVLPVAGPNIGRGTNVNFSPFPSCDSSCAVSTEQCFASCPGGRAADRINPAAAGRNPALAQCQSNCLVTHATCAVGCSVERPGPPLSRAPAPPGNNPPVRPIIPVEEGQPVVPTPLPSPPSAEVLSASPAQPLAEITVMGKAKN